MAMIHAHLASTRPAPVAASGPGPAASPMAEVPAVTSLAKSTSLFLTSAGLRVGFFAKRRATTPATCGHAAEVPLNSPQPSLFAPVLGVIASRALPGWTGNIRLGARPPPPIVTLLPVRPQRSGTWRPG